MTEHQRKIITKKNMRELAERILTEGKPKTTVQLKGLEFEFLKQELREHDIKFGITREETPDNINVKNGSFNLWIVFPFSVQLPESIRL